MKTFGQFFDNLRSWTEKSGRTDAACRDMDDFRRKRCTEMVIPFGREDRGWQGIAKQALSYSMFLEFSREMAKAGTERLADRVTDRQFDLRSFSWVLDSHHEFHHAMLEEARNCGLDVGRLPG